MKQMFVATLLASTSFSLCSAAYAQEARNAAPQVSTDDIVVTATKRSEAVNSVPMSITAASGNALKSAGVTSTDDLGKLVPGFTFTPSAYSAPVYSIRGVGFYDYSIGATPTVTVYVDEAPLPFSTVTRGAAFDLERVEVLKGPQGLLFGSNSTGGAINYVAARPTKDFHAGFDLGYGNFDALEAGGFVSGPLGEGVGARLAVRHESSGDWQRSTTGATTNGGRNFTEMRALLDFESGPFRAKFGFSAFWDKSDSQAAQLIQVNPLIPAFVDPRLGTQPLAGGNARSADWTTGTKPSRDDRFYQGTMRLDYDIGDALTITSLTAYSDYHQNDLVDPDATSLVIADTIDRGTVTAFFQELRLTGETAGVNWIVGANYEKNKVNETQTLTSTDATGFRFFNGLFSIPTPDAIDLSSAQRFETIAGFANVDVPLGDRFTAHAGLRYTDTTDTFTGCTGNSANGSLGLGLSIILGLPASTFADVACTQLGTDLLPTSTHDKLSQQNVSWRVGLDFKPSPGTLVYANVSQGFKSGGFPLLPATSVEQYTSVTQEKLIAYELGFKAALANRAVQLNGAAFYYDYSDKQVLGSVVLTPDIFGPLNRLVNIPKSHVVGAELQLTVRPLRGLTFNASGTWVHSRIGDFTNYDPYGVLRDFKGEAFPNTPEWQFTFSGDYDFAISSGLKGFLGANLSTRSSTNGALGEYKILRIDGYSLLDLRAGIGSADGKWRVSVWGRNVTDQYYWTNAYKIADVTARFAGKPATYGVTLSTSF